MLDEVKSYWIQRTIIVVACRKSSLPKILTKIEIINNFLSSLAGQQL